jgi:hypothetical protein
MNIAPFAAIIGLALVGNALGSVLGAGVALLLPSLVAASLRVVIAFFDWASGLRTEKTLRHRWFLWLDQKRRGREVARIRREKRTVAEREYLEHRGRRAGRGR